MTMIGDIKEGIKTALGRNAIDESVSATSSHLVLSLPSQDGSSLTQSEPEFKPRLVVAIDYGTT